MTKKEIQKKLKEQFGIEVTLRPRKATLQHILNNAIKDKKENKLTSKVTHLDDIYYTAYPEYPKDNKVFNGYDLTGRILFYAVLVFLGALLVTGFMII